MIFRLLLWLVMVGIGGWAIQYGSHIDQLGHAVIGLIIAGVGVIIAGLGFRILFK